MRKPSFPVWSNRADDDAVGPDPPVHRATVDVEQDRLAVAQVRDPSQLGLGLPPLRDHLALIQAGVDNALVLPLMTWFLVTATSPSVNVVAQFRIWSRSSWGYSNVTSARTLVCASQGPTSSVSTK